MSESVNHPKHYNAGKTEVIEFIEDQGMGDGFCLGNAIKYIARAGKKDPNKTVEDLKKARWYLNHQIEVLEACAEDRAPVRPNDMNARNPLGELVAIKVSGVGGPGTPNCGGSAGSGYPPVEAAKLERSAKAAKHCLEAFDKMGTDTLIANAHREICDLASGKKEFGMSIPPQPYDSDMVLQAPLDRLEALNEPQKSVGSYTIEFPHHVTGYGIARNFPEWLNAMKAIEDAVDK